MGVYAQNVQSKQRENNACVDGNPEATLARSAYTLEASLTCSAYDVNVQLLTMLAKLGIAAENCKNVRECR